MITVPAQEAAELIRQLAFNMVTSAQAPVLPETRDLYLAADRLCRKLDRLSPCAAAAPARGNSGRRLPKNSGAAQPGSAPAAAPTISRA